MATTTIDGSTVVFSNSTAAANLTTTINENDTTGGYLFNFDVLAASGGGAKTTLWSVDDGNVDQATTVVLSKGFTGYNTDLLTKDHAGDWEQSTLGAKFAIINGKVAYDASALAGQVNHLGVGESIVDTFQYTIRMSNGTLSVGTLSVTLAGANDDVTIVADGTDASGDVTEGDAATLTDTGSIAFNDVDLTDAHLASVHADGGNTLGGTLVMGTVTEDAATEGGSVGWTYSVAGSATQYLAEGETAVEKFTVTIDDQKGDTVTQEIVVTVTGTNDDPVITTATAAYSINENATGDIATFAFTDLDTIDTHTWSLTGADKDAFTIDADGKLSLTTAQDYESVTQLHVTVNVADNHGGTDSKDITVHINNLPEGPVIYSTPANHVPALQTTGDPKDFDDLVGTGAVHNDATINNSNFASGNADNITGGTADQNIDGQNGNDTIYGGGGNDNVSGSNGNDLLYGQAGNDQVSGGGDLDVIYGGSGNDNPLTGGGGNDTIYGGSGNDTIDGSTGDDLLVGGFGADSLTGGNNVDTFKYVSLNDSGDTITDFASGTDKIVLDASLGFTSFRTDGLVDHGLYFSASAGALYGDTDGNAANGYEFVINITTPGAIAAADITYI